MIEKEYPTEENKVWNIEETEKIEEVTKKEEEVKNVPEEEQDKLREDEEKAEVSEKEEKTPEEETKTQPEEEIEEEVEEDAQEEEVTQNLHIDSAGSVSLNQVVDGRPLKNIIDASGTNKDFQECDRAKIIPTSKLGPVGKDITSAYTMVGLKPDGEIVILDGNVLEPDKSEGNSSSDQDMNVKSNGQIEMTSNVASFHVRGTDYYISASRDEGSEYMAAKISRRYDRGNEEVEFELKKGGAYEDQDAKFARTEQAGKEKSNDMLDKQEEHRKYGWESERVEEIDHNQENDAPAHLNDELISKVTEDIIQESDIIDRFYDKEEVKNAVIQALNHHPQSTPEQVKNMVTRDLETAVPTRQR